MEGAEADRLIVPKTDTFNIIEQNRPKQNACCGLKRRVCRLLLTVSVLGIVSLLIYSVHQINLNRDQIDSKLSTASQSVDESRDSDDVRNFRKKTGLCQDYLLQEGQDGQNYKLSFPDIDYALMGYNVLRGYPLATGHDPGFTYPIFAADYRHGKQTADCRYSVPEGLVVVPDVSCVTSFSSRVVQTQYEYASILSGSASVSFGGWGAKFSASAGYRQSTSQISTGKWVYIISSANCNYYFSKLVKHAPPIFDPNFLWWIRRLNNTSLKDNYIEFFETFGTHFSTEVTFGARFTYEYKMTSQKFQNWSEKNGSVAAEASYSGIFSAGRRLRMSASQKEKASNFLKSVETKTITVGAAPPSNGDAMTWASEVKSSPVPTKYELSSIENLFTEDYMDPLKLRVNLNAIFKRIKDYKYEYCEYLMAKGDVYSCEELAPGMVLEGTRLRNHYDWEKLSYNECIDYCLQQKQCVAISYCQNCEKKSVDYNHCYLYSYADTERTWDSQRTEAISAKDEPGWNSIFFVDKIKRNLRLKDTQVNGVERGFDKEEDKTANASKCYELCVKDSQCVTYSYCECKNVEMIKCKLFGFENVLGFKTEMGTTSYFVPEIVKTVRPTAISRR